MVYDDACGLFGKCVYPRYKSVLVGVTAYTGQRCDLAKHLNVLTEKADGLCTVVQRSAERSDRLIADEQHQRFRAPEVVLQVMADTSGVTHTGCGDDDLGRLVAVYGDRLLLSCCYLQTVKADGVYALADERLHLLVYKLRVALQEDARRFDRKRTVYVNGEVGGAFHKSLFLYFTDKVQHLLRASDGKGGDDHVAAP